MTSSALAAHRSLYGLTFPEVEQFLGRAGVRQTHAAALWKHLYADFRRAGSAPLRLPPPVERWLDMSPPEADAHLPLRVAAIRPSRDASTEKLLIQLEDGNTVETVVMGYPGRRTACLSTQAGCAMGCVFCATGRMGFSRHLTPAEIAGQAIEAQRRVGASGETLRNLVLMGMGEPLHNYDAVMQALAILTHPSGAAIPASRITISTVGVVPGIARMAEERRPYRLALSLHAATDEERRALLPAAARWSLDELMDACRVYTTMTGRHIFVAWTLIDGVNDSAEHARQLVALLTGLPSHVNLIRLNPVRGYGGIGSDLGAVHAFRAVIRTAGIPCTVRQLRGVDVDAGCGQLAARWDSRSSLP